MLHVGMPAELAIRELARDDLDALLALYRHLHAHDDAPPGAVELARLWLQILADRSQIYVGGFVSERLVAACNACVVPNLTRGGRAYAVIENVVTHVDNRREGIGKRVMQALLDRCWARGCYKVMLMSGTSRSEIHGFYESLGFDRHAKQAFVINARAPSKG